MKLVRAARKPARKAGKNRKRLVPKSRKSAVRLEKSQQETFELHDRKGEEWRGWQERKAEELQRQYSRPLDVPPIPQPEGKETERKGLPHFATAILIGAVTGAVALVFSMLVLNLGIFYSICIAFPVFVAFTIMGNDLLETRAG